MFSKSVYKAIPVFFLSFGMFVLLSTLPVDHINIVVQKAEAYETKCPTGMSDADCLKFLQEQAAKINKDKRNLEGQLSKEKYEQLNLTQKIAYLNNQISTRQATMSELEVEIEALNVEIRILTTDIATIQDNLNTLTQETNKLKESIDARVTISYKFNRMSTLEVLLSSEDVDQALRKMKYLSEARKRDQVLLAEYSQMFTQQKTEEDVLAAKKVEVETNRTDIEDKRNKLYNEKLAMATQKSQQEKLVAESKAREKSYNATLASLKAQQNQVDTQVTKLIMSMFSQGQLQNGTAVKKGDIIGFQGHTGYAYGSHLHFGISTKGGYTWSGNIKPFSSGILKLSGNYVVSGSAKAPLDSGYLTQGYHAGNFIDIVSLSRGIQGGSCWSDPDESTCYYIKKGSLKCDRSAQGWFSLQGEGAPIYSIYDGTVYYGVEGLCGGKFALVVHTNSYQSIYLHIR